jgi:peptidoglycan hydrolase-like protein with peptidoglycan-binding domain
VFRLQRALTAALGRSIAIDGLFGGNTTAAVEEYQSGRGLEADGIVGPNTWAALQSGK